MVIRYFKIRNKIFNDQINIAEVVLKKSTKYRHVTHLLLLLTNVFKSGHHIPRATRELD